MKRIKEQKAYIKQITHDYTRAIPKVEIGMFIGYAVAISNYNNRYLIHLHLSNKKFGWNSCVDTKEQLKEFGADEKFWWIDKDDINLQETIKIMEIE